MAIKIGRKGYRHMTFNQIFPVIYILNDTWFISSLIHISFTIYNRNLEKIGKNQALRPKNATYHLGFQIINAIRFISPAMAIRL